MRVISLVPSVTETLLEWGVDVIACTRFCEQPTLLTVGGTKDPDVAAIIALRPELIVVDREENRREDAEALTAAGLRVHDTHVTSWHDVEPTLTALAEATVCTVFGAPPPKTVTTLGAGVEAGEESWATVFVPIWRRPWMTIGGATYGSSLLHVLGVANVYAEHPATYPTVDLTDVAARRPDLVLLPSEPYPFGARHVPSIAEALPEARIELVDGRDLFWWGTRSAGALARLRATLRGEPSPVR